MPDITVNSKDGSFSAYLATPAPGGGPGIVLIQEIFGGKTGVRSQFLLIERRRLHYQQKVA